MSRSHRRRMAELGWFEYIIRLRHAKGIVALRTYSTSRESAIGIVLACEKAPRRAVLSARKIPVRRSRCMP